MGKGRRKQPRRRGGGESELWEGGAPNEISSSCSVFSVDDSALASAMKLNGLPVEEKQSLSTAEISAPTASGKLDFTCWSLWEGGWA